MKFEKTGTKSISVNGHEVNFNQRIEEIIEMSDRVIVNLLLSDFPRDRSFDGRNIVCVSKNGKILWRIENSGVEIEISFGPKILLGYYDLWRPEDGDTIKVGGIDWEYDLDPETGGISNPRIKY